MTRYVFSKIAANHSLGDIFAMGAEAQTALAIATDALWGGNQSRRPLARDVAGGRGRCCTRRAPYSLAGTPVKAQNSRWGFAINGLVDLEHCLRRERDAPWRSAHRVPKALGTGTLFAADMRQRAKGRWITAAIAPMR